MASKALGTLLIKIRADAGQLSSSLKRSQRDVAKWGTKVNLTLGSVAKSIGGKFAQMAKPANALGTALAGAFGLGKIVKAAADYETALVGVVKTTGLAGKDLASFEAEMSGFVKTFAISKGELLGLAEAAGQLGVETKDLAKFTKIMAEMAKASDVAGEEGAKAIARLLTVTKEGVGEADRFTSALVALGNTAKASEGEILHMATMMGQATAVFGVSGADVLGISTAMKELGGRAESSGSSVGRAMIAISTAIESGGASAAAMAETMGMTVEGLATSFEDNAFDTFLTFLDRLKDQGRGAISTLQQFKIAGAEDIKVLLQLAGNTELLRSKLDQANDAWAKNTARAKEAAIANATFNSQMQVLKNNISEITTAIGSRMLPALKGLTSEMLFTFEEGGGAGEAMIALLKDVIPRGLFSLSQDFKSIFTIILGTAAWAADGVAGEFSDAFDSVLGSLETLANEMASAMNTLSLGRVNIGPTKLPKIDYDRDTWDEHVASMADKLGFDPDAEYVSPNKRLDAEASDSLSRARGAFGKNKGLVNSALSELFPAEGVEEVKGAVQEIKKELDSLPQGGGGIDTTLLGGTGSKAAIEKIETVTAKVVDVKEELTTYQTELAAFGEMTFDNLTNFVTEFAQKGSVDFKSFATSAIAELAKIQIKALATKAILGLSKSGGGVGGFFGGVASFFGIDGAKADGGPVRGGGTYLVGERGPELFSPKVSGNITPNEALGSGSGSGGGLAFTQVNHYDGNPNREQMAAFAQQTKNSAIEGVMEIIAHGGQPAQAFAQ